MHHSGSSHRRSAWTEFARGTAGLSRSRRGGLRAVAVMACGLPMRAARRRVLIFEYEICRQSDQLLLAEGETTHVIVNREGRPCALPDNSRDLFLAGIKIRQD